MEKQLFDWESWDQADGNISIFYNISLREPIGSYPIGSKFETASIDYENSTLTLQLPDKYRRFKLTLQVEEEEI